MFIVFDLDGTLADITHRLHHVRGNNKNYRQFYASVSEDKPKTQVISLLKELSRAGNRIEIWSGRSDESRSDTEDWLMTYGLDGYDLKMRPKGDHQPDVDLKRSWLMQAKRKPDAVFDDRSKVVQLWRDEGILCCQVDQWEEMDKVGEKFERIDPRDPDEPMLTIMVGPSGAGKSNYLDRFPEEYKVVSSDDIRERLCGDFKDQSRNDEVFHVVHKLIKTYIDCGIPVVYDATNLRNKDRKKVVELCPSEYIVKYFVMDRPLKQKIEDGGWRNDVIMKTGQTLIEYHDQIFKSNLKDILDGDGYDNVTVVDYRDAISNNSDD
jgi:predicted kinase